MRERAEGRDEGTERIARDGKQDEGRKARRDEMMRGKNCRLLANLPTCLLANLPTCQLAYYTYYAFHSVPSSSYPRPVERYERRGGFFLIRSSYSPNAYSPRHAPFSLAHFFSRLVVPFRSSHRRAYVTQSFRI